MIVIGGATATGKTQVAAAVAKRLNGELISADSMQIYRGMDIGTAKERDEDIGVAQHMIDIVNPDEPFTVVDYREKAEKAIAEVEAAGKLPIVVGGTGFYISSLLYPFHYGETFEKISNSENIRSYWQKVAREKGNAEVWAALQIKDPIAAEKIHPNNLKRVIRALEVIESTGKPFSAQKTERVMRPNVNFFYMELDRALLTARIYARIDEMFRRGLEQEVYNLHLKYSFDLQSMQGIGYKEWRGYFENNCSYDDVKEAIFLNTKHYAKRQETWFRKQYGDEIKKMSGNYESKVDYICKHYENNNNL